MIEGKLEDFHTDILTDRFGKIEKNSELLKNIRFKAHILLSSYFPEYFPQIAVANKAQRAEIKNAVAKRLLSKKHSQQQSKATEEEVYAVERIQEKTWAELQSILTPQQHLEVAIKVLKQINEIFLKTGVIVADRNSENIFVAQDLSIKQSDFSEVYDSYSDDHRDPNLNVDRTVALARYTLEIKREIKDVINDVLSIVIVVIGIGEENRDDVVDKLHKLNLWLDSVTLVDEQVKTILPIVINKLETIWNESF